MEKQHYKMYKDGKKWVFAAVTVIALGVGLSESTYVVKADSTVTIASTDDSVNTGAASKNPTVPGYCALSSLSQLVHPIHTQTLLEELSELIYYQKRFVINQDFPYYKLTSVLNNLLPLTRTIPSKHNFDCS